MPRSSEFWGGLFWLALGAFTVSAGRDLGLGVINDPGSGFALFWVGVLAVCLALSVLVASFRTPGAPLAELWRDTRWQKVLAVITMLLVFGVLFETLGFVVCSVALLLALMTLIDPIEWRYALPLAILTPLGIWYAVTKGLLVQMPAGILEGWIG